MTGKSVRVAYWDNWKGIAILAVVAIHAANDTSQFAIGSFNWLFGLTLRQVIDFAVPIFLALAGFFSVGSLTDSPRTYYKKRINRILIPYLIWTTIYLFLKTPFDVPSISEVIQGYILGRGIGIGYFIIVLLQFIVLTPFLHKVKSQKTHIGMMVIGSILGSVFTYYFYAVNPEHFMAKFPQNVILFFVWYPFYHFGYYAARYKIQFKIEQINSLTLIYFLGVALTLAFIEGYFWGYNGNYRFGVSQLKLTSFITSFILFLNILHFQKQNSLLNTSTSLTWLGSHSFAIYLIHILFLNKIQFILRKIEWIHYYQPIFITLSIVATLLLCVITILITKKIAGSTYTKPILG